VQQRYATDINRIIADITAQFRHYQKIHQLLASVTPEQYNLKKHPSRSDPEKCIPCIVASVHEGSQKWPTLLVLGESTLLWKHFKLG